MPENRKFFPHNAAVFCTARTEVGLPFIATYSMNFILWGILARAQEQFAVKVCHFIFMANHFHMLLVVDNPADVSRFIGYVKAESAHAVNRLLGRRQRTIWKNGYDSPIVLTARDAMKCIRYIYLNPTKPSLVTTIDEYPGVSSWQMFITKSRSVTCKRVCRDKLTPLHSPALSINEQKRLVDLYEETSIFSSTLHLDPNAWMKCFPELRDVDEDETNRQIIEGIRSQEAEYATQRAKDKRDVLGSTTLRRESMTKEYVPTTFGRKSICLCWDKVYRKSFIGTYRFLCTWAKEIYEQWKLGDTSLRIPLGLFAPHMPMLGSLLSPPA